MGFDELSQWKEAFGRGKGLRSDFGRRSVGLHQSILVPTMDTSNDDAQRTVPQASLLDMTGVCANRDVWHTKKAVLNYFRDFEAIEVLLSHLHKNPLDCFLDTFCRERTENSCLHFLSYEKEVPAGGMDLAIKGEPIDGLDHAPVP